MTWVVVETWRNPFGVNEDYDVDTKVIGPFATEGEARSYLDSLPYPPETLADHWDWKVVQTCSPDQYREQLQEEVEDFDDSDVVRPLR